MSEIEIDKYYICCHLKQCAYNDGIGCCALEGKQANHCVTNNFCMYAKILHPKGVKNNVKESCRIHRFNHVRNDDDNWGVLPAKL
jgi:hypothetical protein